MSQRRSTLNSSGGAVDNSFKFSIDTSLGDGLASFEIPTGGGGTYLYDVDWGDGNTDLSQIGSITHAYSSGGVYQITITGGFTNIYFNNVSNR